jgi:hypothetical protein
VENPAQGDYRAICTTIPENGNFSPVGATNFVAVIRIFVEFCPFFLPDFICKK